ncbi:MAG: peptidoglycan -binding protein [Proteobacteria bacterium]|nr:peptidoglycan -binding protein [Pseudomonadota bacterium]
MAAISRRDRSSFIWPGFVDALATLLMVIIFLLMIFVLAQFFLGQALSGRDKALRQLENDLSRLTQVLALEKAETARLNTEVSSLTQQLSASLDARAGLEVNLTALRGKLGDTESQLAGALATNKADKEAITRQLAEIADLSRDISALKALKGELEREVSALSVRAAEAEKAKDKLDKDLTISVKKLGETSSERDKLKVGLANEREISESARAQLALLNHQMSALRAQLDALNAALDAAESDAKSKDVRIEALGQRLNAALAGKVQELTKYRSEFFGRLRDLLGRRQDVRIVGDRFVLQSEVLFAKSAAELGDVGKQELDKLARTLLEIARKMPADIKWILQIDGHTDKDPIATAKFPSNWELSTARALSVLHHLVSAGIPADKLAASGFGEYSPIADGDGEAVKAKNRRIEFKFTQR